jgi:hypothetical protein
MSCRITDNMLRPTYDTDWVSKATPEALARLWAAIFGSGNDPPASPAPGPDDTEDTISPKYSSPSRRSRRGQDANTCRLSYCRLT